MFVNTKIYLTFCILVTLIFSCFIISASSININTSIQMVNTYDHISKYFSFEKTPDEIARASEGVIIHNIERSTINNN
ncbi:hypothetical protein [Clostridium sp. DJ247]|uniref:hypothetical protein n=1 Tax=Clostridium sp. DJ247 TaxID=2726188 RepID=UPI001625CF23|nr:hypothetical protein [Clostridium sp. DJ247]MBC2581787.1 hypothetical protein [Clostridium sp. DJ247]